LAILGGILAAGHYFVVAPVQNIAESYGLTGHSASRIARVIGYCIVVVPLVAAGAFASRLWPAAVRVESSADEVIFTFRDDQWAREFEELNSGKVVRGDLGTASYRGR
jgi:hypothetical protein